MDRKPENSFHNLFSFQCARLKITLKINFVKALLVQMISSAGGRKQKAHFGETKMSLYFFCLLHKPITEAELYVGGVAENSSVRELDTN